MVRLKNGAFVTFKRLRQNQAEVLLQAGRGGTEPLELLVPTGKGRSQGPTELYNSAHPGRNYKIFQPHRETLLLIPNGGTACIPKPVF